MKLGATAMPATPCVPFADARGASVATGAGDFQCAVLGTNLPAAPAILQGSASRPSTSNLPVATLIVATSAPLPPPALADAAPPPADPPIATSRHDEDGAHDAAAPDPTRDDQAPPEAITPLASTDIVVMAVAEVTRLVVKNSGAIDRFASAANPAHPADSSIAAPTAPALAPTGGMQQRATATAGDGDAVAGLIAVAGAQSTAAPRPKRAGEPPAVETLPPRLPVLDRAAADTFSRPGLPESVPSGSPKPQTAVGPAPVEPPPSRYDAVLPKPPAVVAETATVAAAAAAPPPVAADGAIRPIVRSKPVLAAPGDTAMFAAVPAAAGAPVAAAPPTPVPVVHIIVQPQQLARDVGRAIARQLGAAGHELLIRLDPAQLGRIDVRLSFDDLGTLRAVVGAETAQVLDLLRRDSADLGRALADAGVRSDSQSFRFEDRGGDQRQDRPQPQRPRGIKAEDLPDVPGADRFQPLRWRGQMNVIA